MSDTALHKIGEYAVYSLVGFAADTKDLLPVVMYVQKVISSLRELLLNG